VCMASCGRSDEDKAWAILDSSSSPQYHKKKKGDIVKQWIVIHE
jgi:hypothetical protein